MRTLGVVMETLSKQHIVGECLSIDDKHFTDCTLTDCMLEYSGGDVVFERTTLKGCRHIFYGPARGTLHYLQNVGLLALTDDWGEYSDTVN
jgi:hypothetical protein